MDKYIFQIKTMCVRTLVLGCSLTFFTSSNVTAQPIYCPPHSKTIVEQTVYRSEALLDKHQDIDRFIFGQYEGRFPAKGFKVIYTWLHNGYIEIGIIPYEEVSAAYFYKLFGNKIVKVLEAKEAVLFPNA